MNFTCSSISERTKTSAPKISAPLLPGAAAAALTNSDLEISMMNLCEFL
jgi:hypothetical protein